MRALGRACPAQPFAEPCVSREQASPTKCGKNIRFPAEATVKLGGIGPSLEIKGDIELEFYRQDFRGRFGALVSASYSRVSRQPRRILAETRFECRISAREKMDRSLRRLSAELLVNSAGVPCARDSLGEHYGY
jgi:hypothetical protein